MHKLIRSYEYGVIPNSHDILKCVALLAMIIDHLGFYFFPEALWLRAIGRMAFPLFLFMVGYNANWRFDRWLVIGAVLVLLGNGLSGVPLFPLNILFSILLWRGVMGWLSQRPALINDLLLLWVAMLVVHLGLQFFIPHGSVSLVEYGVCGLMFALLGWHQRQGRADKPIRVAWLVTLALYAILQTKGFGFSGGMAAYFITQTVLMGLLLMQFRPRDFPLPRKHTTPSPTWQERLVILSSRNTLLLYVAHLLLFQALAVMLYPQRHSELFVLLR